MNQNKRRERLESALHTLAAWASNEARCGTEVDKPIEKLERLIAQVRPSVDRAGEEKGTK